MLKPSLPKPIGRFSDRTVLGEDISKKDFSKKDIVKKKDINKENFIKNLPLTYLRDSI